ncbi:MAG: hypothetical protein AB7D36_01200 [Oscillospiraceae bacterium]
MTGKLLKYEFRSMIKQFAIIWPAALLIALINGLTQTVRVKSSVIGNFWASNIMILLFVGVMIAMFVASAVFIIGRFRSGLLRDEGYLMFTLPVTPVQLIFAKLIAAVVVIIISAVVGILSMFLLFSGSIEWHYVINQIGLFLSQMSAEVPLWWVIFIEVIILTIVGIAHTVLQIYVSISIGHLAKKHRTALAIIAFIVVTSLTSTITGAIMDALDRAGIGDFIQNFLETGKYFALSQYTILFMLGIVTLFAAVYFILSAVILSRKLNLE